jgi:hypothetical protein
VREPTAWPPGLKREWDTEYSWDEPIHGTLLGIYRIHRIHRINETGEAENGNTTASFIVKHINIQKWHS